MAKSKRMDQLITILQTAWFTRFAKQRTGSIPIDRFFTRRLRPTEAQWEALAALASVWRFSVDE